jgi:hypothetical protein
VIGQRVLDFRKDGLAHYGMLADMAAALRSVPGGQKTFDRLFRSAEDVIRMWELIEARKLVLAARRTSACVSFGAANTTKSANGVACLTLTSTGSALPPLVRVTSDPAGTLAGDGYLDLYVSNCALSNVRMRILEPNQWVVVPLASSAACPLRLRVQGEPGDGYGLQWKPWGT